MNEQTLWERVHSIVDEALKLAAPPERQINVPLSVWELEFIIHALNCVDCLMGDELETIENPTERVNVARQRKETVELIRRLQELVPCSELPDFGF
jgi:hypothetical protein